MDAATLINRYQSGKRDFSWADLSQLDLSGAQMADINLYRATLAGANLTKANLTKANLFKANLSGANLLGANLAGANLRKANLQGAQCDTATLQGADWHGAILPDALAETLAQAAVNLSPESLTTGGDFIVQDGHESGMNGAVTFENGEPSSSHEGEPSALDVSPTSSSPAHPSLPSDRWAAAVPLLAEPVSPQPDPKQDPVGQRDLAMSMAHLGFGLWCFGYILGAFQSFWPAGLLVWMALLLGLWKEDLAWYVPIAGSTAVLLGTGVSLGALIFIGLATLMLLGSFSVYGNILGWGIGKTLGTTLWFGGLIFTLIHAALWLFDGSNAYGGGGIVVNLAQFQVGLLLIVGTIALGRGALGYLQLNDGRYSPRQQFLYVGGSGVLGLLLGVALGRG